MANKIEKELLEDVASFEVKKINEFNGSFIVFLTPEAKLLGWDIKTKVIITVADVKKGIITIRKAPGRAVLRKPRRKRKVK